MANSDPIYDYSDASFQMNKLCTYITSFLKAKCSGGTSITQCDALNALSSYAKSIILALPTATAPKSTDGPDIFQAKFGNAPTQEQLTSLDITDTELELGCVKTSFACQSISSTKCVTFTNYGSFLCSVAISYDYSVAILQMATLCTDITTALAQPDLSSDKRQALNDLQTYAKSVKKILPGPSASISPYELRTSSSFPKVPTTLKVLNIEDAAFTLSCFQYSFTQAYVVPNVGVKFTDYSSISCAITQIGCTTKSETKGTTPYIIGSCPVDISYSINISMTVSFQFGQHSTGNINTLELTGLPSTAKLFIGTTLDVILNTCPPDYLVQTLDMTKITPSGVSIRSINTSRDKSFSVRLSIVQVDPTRPGLQIAKGLARSLTLYANEKNAGYDYTTFFYGLESLDLSQVTTTTIDTLVNGSTYPTTLQSITMPPSLNTLSVKLPPTLTNIDLSLTKITELDCDFSSFKDLTTLKLPQTLTVFSSNLKNTPLSSLNVLNTSTHKCDDLPTTLTSFTATLGGTKITKLSFAGGSLNNFVPGSLPETLTCLDLSLSLITSC